MTPLTPGSTLTWTDHNGTVTATVIGPVEQLAATNQTRPDSCGRYWMHNDTGTFIISQGDPVLGDFVVGEVAT